MSFVYAMIAAGVSDKTGRFWLAVFWPYYLGKEIGAFLVSKKEGKTDGR